MKRSMNKPLALLIGLCLAATAVAQNNEGSSEPSFIVYKIKSGDNISKLAHKYFIQSADLEEIQKANQLQNIDLLKIGANLNIPRQLVKTKPSSATIIGLSCATAIRVDSSTKPLSVGSVVAEGAVIEVPAECHASLLLEDGSVIRLPSSASLKITTLRKNALESAPEVKLDLARGRIELDVNKNRSKSTPFEVRTPLSIMGVRGTEFRVGYSPDEQTGQVEVLGGTVQTRGSTDATSRPITKGLGVPIDSDGKALAIEKLLDAPLFESAQPTQGAQPSYVVALAPVALASYYTAVNANSATFNEAKSSQQLLTPELFIPRLSRQATFYQLSSASESGLIGIERNYAFCAALAGPQTARCSAVFSVPLAEGSAINFQLSRTTDQAAQPLVNAQNLQARNGRFAIQGLPAGRYTWALSYAMNDNAGAQSKKHLHAQSGSFELILLPTDKP
jgi:LysM repeat protein